MLAEKIAEYRVFIAFSLTGSAAFLIDASVLTGLILLGLGPIVSRCFSFLVAVTFTWYINRTITFKSHDRRYFYQWCKFLSANAIGGMMNICVYAIAIKSNDYFMANPVLGVALGSIAGLFCNFYLSKRFVFSAAEKDA